MTQPCAHGFTTWCEICSNAPTVMTMTNTEKVAAWDAVASAWVLYCRHGAGSFDWDYDSRPLMTRLTGERVTYWYGPADGSIE